MICAVKKEYSYYRYRNCDTNLNANTPANRYQLQKQIQKTVRVSSSEYAMNKAALNATTKEKHVPWNQQSDRALPSVQKSTIPTGTNTSMNKKHTSQTSSRPGTQTPGGIGCDIKHNSYDRYLNRLKGAKAFKRESLPDIFYLPSLPFNQAYPIYGSKLVKTAIVHGGGPSDQGCVECTSSTNNTNTNTTNITNNYFTVNINDFSSNEEKNTNNTNKFSTHVDDTVNFPTSSASNFIKQKKHKTTECFVENSATPFLNI